MVYYGVVGWAICYEDEEMEMKMLRMMMIRKQH